MSIVSKSVYHVYLVCISWLKCPFVRGFVIGFVWSNSLLQAATSQAAGADFISLIEAQPTESLEDGVEFAVDVISAGGEAHIVVKSVNATYCNGRNHSLSYINSMRVFVRGKISLSGDVNHNETKIIQRGYLVAISSCEVGANSTVMKLPHAR